MLQETILTAGTRSHRSTIALHMKKQKISDHTIQFHSVSLDYLQYKSEKANLDIISPPQSQGSTILHKTGSTNQEVDPQSRSRKLQI
jgi:hypothetical protein